LSDRPSQTLGLDVKHIELNAQGEAIKSSDWPRRCFVTDHGLYQSLGTIRYPGGAHAL